MNLIKEIKAKLHESMQAVEQAAERFRGQGKMEPAADCERLANDIGKCYTDAMGIEARTKEKP